AILIAALYAAIPPVWINAAWWGQVDVLISLPMIASLLLLDYGRGRWSWILWGTATMVKVHAVILAPVLFLLTLRRHGTRGLVEGGAFASLVIGLFCLPLILTGGGPGLYQAIIGSVGRFPQATNRAYNLWWLVVNGQQITDLITVGGLTYRTIGFILLVVATGLSCLAIIRRSGSASSTAAAATIALAFFTLPTQIHERYSFFVMPLLLLCAITDLRALIPFALITITATVNVIGAMPAFVPEMAQVIANSNIPALVAWVNVLTLIGLLIFAWVERREW
ncbi:MAG: hypothetical protein HGA65_18570, partial [Oscillochloris sp.]|nr:hypothetical protein [Oscillochloris sp.]